MPRNGAGVYSKPAGTTATPNTTISSSTFNAVVDDLAADANAIRPISAGGTGAANADAAVEALGAMRRSSYDPDGDGVVAHAAQADYVPWSGVTNKPSSYQPADHSHAAASISDASDAGRALLTAANAAAQRTALGLGAAAQREIGTAANNVVALDADGKLPALNGSQLTGIAAGGGARRQTVLNGPVTAGAPSFLAGAYAGLAVAMQNVSAETPLVVSAAMGYGVDGSIDRYGRVVANLSWAAVVANTTSYLPLAVAADGTVTTAAPQTLKPIYQQYGTPSTVAGQYTFNIGEMQMYLGNGTVAVPVAHVIVGLVVAGASSVTSTVAYAYNGYYESGFSISVPAGNTAVSKNHNIGACQTRVVVQFKVLTSIGNYSVGDIFETVGSASTYAVATTYTDLTAGFNLGSGGFLANKTTGANTTITSSTSVGWQIIAQRAF